MEIWNDINCQTIKHRTTINRIALSLCLMHGVSIADVKSDNRESELVYVRHKIAKEADSRGYTSSEIGDYLNKERSSINHYLNNYKPPESISQ